MFFFKKKSFTLNSYFKRIFPQIKNKNNKDSILFHFSSLGEMNAAKPLINYFKNRQKNIIITVFTETAYKEALNISQNTYYIPFDFYFIIKRFIKKLNPSYIFITETEIWPTFTKLASLYSKVIWINARMSEKSYKRYSLISFFIEFIFEKIEKIFVQTEQDLKYFSKFLLKDKIQLVGNTKYDNLVLSIDEELNKKIYKWKKDSFCVVFGSIHPEETETIINSYKLLKKESIDVKYILVPRHIEKLPDFINLIEKNKLLYIIFSEYEKSDLDSFSEILIFDKVGYLSKLYYNCDIAFVGGTLNNKGGHNLLEPSLYAKPVLFGPNYFSQTFSANKLIEEGGGFVVSDEYEIKARIKFFIFNKQKLNEAGEKSFKVLKKLSGATDKIIRGVKN